MAEFRETPYGAFNFLVELEQGQGREPRAGFSVRRNATRSRMSWSGRGKPGMPAPSSPSRTSVASPSSSRAKSRVTMPGPSSPPLPSPPWHRAQTFSK